jgi:hypothetical protein
VIVGIPGAPSTAFQPAGATFGAAAQPEGVVSPLLKVTPVRRVNV